MPRMQELLTQSIVQNLGLGEILATRMQEAKQAGDSIRRIGQYQAQEVQNKNLAQQARNRELGETVGTLGGAVAGAYTAPEGQRLERATLGASIGQGVGGALSGAQRQPGQQTFADVGVNALQQGQQLKLLGKQRESQKMKQNIELAKLGDTFTPDSLQVFSQTGNVSDLVKISGANDLDTQKKQAEIEKIKAQTQEIKQKPIIEKNKKAEEKRVNLVQDRAELERVSSNIDNVIRNIDELLYVEDEEGNKIPNEKLAKGTGIESLYSFFPSTTARNIDAQLKTIQANAAFTALQEMRNASKTGGALGQVSEKEIDFLQSKVDTLDPGQTDENFVKNLKSVRDEFEKVKKRAQKRFNELYPDQKNETQIGRFKVRAK